MAIRLFAYGTLQVGHEAAHLLDVVAAESGSIAGFRLYDSGLGWPFAARGAPGELVHGQVLTLAGDDASDQDVVTAFARADPWEGYDPADPDGSSYLRVAVEVVTADQRRLEAHAYISSVARLRRHYGGLTATRLERGVWVRA